MVKSVAPIASAMGLGGLVVAGPLTAPLQVISRIRTATTLTLKVRQLNWKVPLQHRKPTQTPGRIRRYRYPHLWHQPLKP